MELPVAGRFSPSLQLRRSGGGGGGGVVVPILLLVLLLLSHPSVCHSQKKFPGNSRFGGGGGGGGELREQCSNLVDEMASSLPGQQACRGGSGSGIGGGVDTTSTIGSIGGGAGGGGADTLAVVAKTMTQGFLQSIWKIVLYQPPVGIVSLLTISKLIFSGRLFRFEGQPSPQEASEKVLQRASSQKRKRGRHRGRAFQLDGDDTDYQSFGGVERIRRRLCWAALNTMLEGDKEYDDHDLNDHFSFVSTTVSDTISRDLIKSIVDVLRLSYSPGGSRSHYVESMLEPMARIERNLVTTRRSLLKTTSISTTTQKTATSGQTATVSSKDETEWDQIIRMAAMTAEIRVLDGLLRVLRDRLLRLSFRLSRTKQHWKKKLHQSQATYNFEFWKQLVKDSTEGDRLRLAFATSAYGDEIKRLGKVIQIIMERPSGLDDSKLSQAVRYTAFDGGTTATASTNDDNDVGNHQVGGRTTLRIPKPKKEDWAMPKASRFSFQFNRDGKGKFHLTSFDKSMTVGGQGAIQVLLADDDATMEEWMERARQWTSKARRILYEVIEESITENTKPTEEEEQILARLESWTVGNFQEKNNDDDKDENYDDGVGIAIHDQWNTIFERVENIHKDSRLGEGQKVRFKEYTQWFREWDFFGLPSTAAYIFTARLANKWLDKNWSIIRDGWQETFDISMKIFKERFYFPIKEIVDDVMSREKSSLTGIALKDEELCLDNMLRDLKFGDGTPGNRHDALLSAMRQYESDLNTGLLRHALGGRLVRLMLIQIQQLKVGALHAAETIDVLLQSNKINIQLLAIIPGIMMIVVGTRMFSRFWFRFRSRDIRSIRTVHAEMTEYLNKLEHLLLMADPAKVVQDDGTTKTATTTARRSPQQSQQLQLLPLQVDELGEFTLILYNYLVLLDYSCPVPFPNRKCDAIHRSVQDFLGSNGSLYRFSGNIDRQIALICQVKERHSELSQYL